MEPNEDTKWAYAKLKALTQARGKCKCEAEEHDHDPLRCTREPDGKHYALKPGRSQTVPDADNISAVCRLCHSMNLKADKWVTIRLEVWARTHGYCQCSRFEHQHKHRQCQNPIAKGSFKLVVPPLDDPANFSPANLWGVCAWCFKATPLPWRVSESPRPSYLKRR
jgi:hypothetical protein